jgi:hypothetical protein
VVSDGQTNELRWFDAAGAHLATRGGRGKGPGEFTSLPMLIKLPGDIVLAQNAPTSSRCYTTSRPRCCERNPSTFLAIVLSVAGVSDTYAARSVTARLPAGTRFALGCTQSARAFAYVRALCPGAMVVGWILPAGALRRYRAVGDRCRWGDPLRCAPVPCTVVAAGGDPLRVAIALNAAHSIEIWTPDGRLERIVQRSEMPARLVPSSH